MKFQLTPAQFATRAALVEKETGSPLTGNSGEIAHSGVKVAYNYDGTAELTVTILHVPFPLSQGFVEHKLTTWFNS